MGSVITRTFVSNAGGAKKFWDISWFGIDVEITQGSWGTAGRVTSKDFDSVEERDAFIEKHIRAAQKKGFQEIHSPAPVDDNAEVDVGAERRPRAWLAHLQTLVRPAWLPRFSEPGKGNGSARIRGAMMLGPGESWPHCKICRKPMNGVFELDLRLVPPSSLRRDALVQLFLCEDGPEPCIANDGWLTRLVPPDGVRAYQPSELGTPREISGWDEVCELPAWEQLPSDLAEALDAFEPNEMEALVRVGKIAEKSEEIDPCEAYLALIDAMDMTPRMKNKLGGWPSFVQPCSLTWTEQLFQIEDGGAFSTSFGDVGAGHILLSVTGQAQFYWASH